MFSNTKFAHYTCWNHPDTRVCAVKTMGHISAGVGLLVISLFCGNMLNFAPLPLPSDAVQILFLVKYATVKGCRPVKRLQYDDVCNGQLISVAFCTFCIFNPF